MNEAGKRLDFVRILHATRYTRRHILLSVKLPGDWARRYGKAVQQDADVIDDHAQRQEDDSANECDLYPRLHKRECRMRVSRAGESPDAHVTD